MSVLRIRTMGDPVLRTAAAPVQRVDEHVRTLIRDMTETMLAVDGVGLAAPQVGVGLQIFTWFIDGTHGHVLNPRLELGTELQTGGEGCLSVPGLGDETPRRDLAILTGTDVDGHQIEITARGLLARCFQHEYDHLQGTLFVDRLEGEPRKNAMRRIRSSRYQDEVARVTAEREAQRLRGTGQPGALAAAETSSAFGGSNGTPTGRTGVRGASFGGGARA